MVHRSHNGRENGQKSIDALLKNQLENEALPVTLFQRAGANRNVFLRRKAAFNCRSGRNTYKSIQNDN